MKYDIKQNNWYGNVTVNGEDYYVIVRGTNDWSTREGMKHGIGSVRDYYLEHWDEWASILETAKQQAEIAALKEAL